MSIVLTPGDPLDVLSLVDAKAHLNVTFADDDALITDIIGRAVAKVQKDSGKVLADTAYTQYCTGFPAMLTVDRGPMKSLDEIRYIDTDEAQQVLNVSVYDVFNAGALHLKGYAKPKIDQEWPDVSSRDQSVEIDFTCGFPVGEIPADLISAVTLLVTYLYENRGDTAAVLPNTYRMMTEGNVSRFAG